MNKPSSDERRETPAADPGAAPETRFETCPEESPAPLAFSPDLLADLVHDGNAPTPSPSSFRLEM